MTYKVFVYGTLKKGGRLNHYLDESRFVENKIIKGYSLYNLGWFPGIQFTGEETDVVHGEVWEISGDTLTILDRVEGVPTLYTRIEDDDMFLYLYNGDVSNYGQIKTGIFDVNN